MRVACADPGVETDAVRALIAHRLTLAECAGAAIINDTAWRRISAGLADD